MSKRSWLVQSRWHGSAAWSPWTASSAPLPRSKWRLTIGRIVRGRAKGRSRTARGEGNTEVGTYGIQDEGQEKNIESIETSEARAAPEGQGRQAAESAGGCQAVKGRAGTGTAAQGRAGAGSRARSRGDFRRIQNVVGREPQVQYPDDGRSVRWRRQIPRLQSQRPHLLHDQRMGAALGVSRPRDDAECRWSAGDG